MCPHNNTQLTLLNSFLLVMLSTKKFGQSKTFENLPISTENKSKTYHSTNIRETNDSKSWATYVKAYINSNIYHTSIKAGYIMTLEGLQGTLSIKRLIRYTTGQEWHEEYITIQKFLQLSILQLKTIVVSPLFHLEVHNANLQQIKDNNVIFPETISQYIKHIIKVKTELSWNFLLVDTNRLKIVFYKLQVHYLNPVSCTIFVRIDNLPKLSSNDILMFCGIYEGLNIFPPKNNLILSIFSVPLPWFHINASFNILSPQNLSAHWERIFCNNVGIQMHMLVNTKLSQSIAIFSLVTHKYNVLILTLKGTRTTDFFDGPGVLSMKYSGLTTETIQSSSFHCALHVYLSNTPHDKWINFSSINDFIKWRIFNIIQNKSFVLKISPVFQCASTDNSSNKFLLTSARNESFINISVLDFNFLGASSPNCTFGGISFYDVFGEKISEFKLHQIREECPTRFEDQHNIQSIFSYSNKVLVTAHMFLNYSVLTTQLKAFLTFCLTVRHKFNTAVYNARVYQGQFPPEVVAFTQSLKRDARDVPTEELCGYGSIQYGLSNLTCIILQLRSVTKVKLNRQRRILPSITVSKRILGLQKLLPTEILFYQYKMTGYLSDYYMPFITSNYLFDYPPHLVAGGSEATQNSETGEYLPCCEVKNTKFDVGNKSIRLIQATEGSLNKPYSET